MFESLISFWQTNQSLVILFAVLIVVIPFLVFYIVKARREHPKGLIPAALANMGERFGYYIMNAVLLLFLCSKFGISDDAAGWIYAVFYFLIYVLSLPGGMIADRTQMAAPLVQQYLARLEGLSVVRRVVPLVRAKRRQVRYELADSLFRFHYRFGVKYAAAAGAGMSALAAGEIVGRELATFVGPVFEEVARQWLMRQMAAGKIDVIPLGVGTWWGTNPQTKREEEIDVVVQGAHELLLGECKWTDSPVDSSVLGTLRRRASLLNDDGDVRLFLFSKSGFETECVQRASTSDGATLVTVGEMFSG